MNEYYPFIFGINSKEHICIWFSKEDDGFLMEDGQLLTFESLEMLKSYARSNDLNIRDENHITKLSIDSIIEMWEEKKEIDCVGLLNFWNAIGDIAKSAGLNFCGDTNELTYLYNKLFYGNNLPVLRGVDGELYTPKLEDQELMQLNLLIEDGLRILEVCL